MASWAKCWTDKPSKDLNSPQSWSKYPVTNLLFQCKSMQHFTDNNMICWQMHHHKSTQTNYKQPGAGVKFSCPLCNIITQLIYIQRGLRDSNCSSGGKVSGFCDVGCAVKPYTHVWSVKPAVKLCVALFFSLIPSPFPAGDTFLGHEYIWYISSRCVSCISAFRCSYSWKSFSAVGTTEGMNVYLLKLCDSSNYSRLLLYAAPFSCHLAISRTDVVGVRLLKFKEWITH